MDKAINLKEKLSLFTDHWSPKVVAEMNDYQFKLAKIKGEFIWHSHLNTDETFIVLEGQLIIQLRDKEIILNQGDLYVVKAGVEHRPIANEEVKIMLIEPKGLVNTGDIENKLTAKNDVWI